MSRRAPRGLQATACDETRTAKVVFRSGRLSFQPIVSCESHQMPSTPKLKSVVARSKTLQRVSAPLVFCFFLEILQKRHHFLQTHTHRWSNITHYFNNKSLRLIITLNDMILPSMRFRWKSMSNFSNSRIMPFSNSQQFLGCLLCLLSQTLQHFCTCCTPPIILRDPAISYR